MAATPLGSFLVGSQPSIAVLFQRSGVAADPSGVTYKVINPNGTPTTLTYGTDPGLVRDSTGVYHVAQLLNVVGTWYGRFTATGMGAVPVEFSIVAVAGNVPYP